MLKDKGRTAGTPRLEPSQSSLYWPSSSSMTESGPQPKMIPEKQRVFSSDDPTSKTLRSRGDSNMTDRKKLIMIQEAMDLEIVTILILEMSGS
jgi:hypothetical protein